MIRVHDAARRSARACSLASCRRSSRRPSTDEALREGGRHGAGPARVALLTARHRGGCGLARAPRECRPSDPQLHASANIDPGFRSGGSADGARDAPADALSGRSAGGRFFANALSRIERLPGVQSAAGISLSPPLAGPGIGTELLPSRSAQASRRSAAVDSGHVQLTPGFFRTMGIRHTLPAATSRLGHR